MLRMWTAIQSRINDDEGASLVEYALLVALIAIVAVTTVGEAVSSNFDNVGSQL